MHDSVRLLMEETDCEQGEAELALELAGNDLEQAIKTIGSLLRHIYALKGKFSFPQKNLYGLLLVVINTKTQEIYRLRSVVSYNPALYENPPSMDWFTLEKRIFTYRLDQGSLPDFTQEFEERLRSCLIGNKDIFHQFNIDTVSNLFTHFFESEGGTVSLAAEELNLTQFRQLPSDMNAIDNKATVLETDVGIVFLTVTLEDEESGREVSRLAQGDVIIARITDTRDIAHYLAHLVGAKKGGEMIPLPASIKKISIAGDMAEVQVYFAPNIIGVAHLKTDMRVKTVDPHPQSWWKKMIPWE
ncbi:MAG: hypothetical protein NTU66_05615 [Elusimicrobia bacterium]|nr:hypothetical protein [Elusimicrobiota bacterium]